MPIFAVAIKWFFIGTKKSKKMWAKPQAAAWTVDARQDGFMLFIPNSDPTIWILQRKVRLITRQYFSKLPIGSCPVLVILLWCQKGIFT